MKKGWFYRSSCYNKSIEKQQRRGRIKECSKWFTVQTGNNRRENKAVERFNQEADLLISEYLQFLAILIGGLDKWQNIRLIFQAASRILSIFI